MEKLKKEVSMERRLRLSESDRVIQGQRKLYEAECNVEKLQHQNMKLHLQHEAMCMKYEPGMTKTRGHVHEIRARYDKNMRPCV